MYVAYLFMVLAICLDFYSEFKLLPFRSFSCHVKKKKALLFFTAIKRAEVDIAVQEGVGIISSAHQKFSEYRKISSGMI